MAKFGIPVCLLGAVGDDPLGRELIGKFDSYDVDTTRVLFSGKAHTGIGVVNFIRDGSVTATISHGANFELRKKHIDEFFPVIENSGAVLFQLETPADVVRYGITRAAETDSLVILNASPVQSLDEEILRKVDCFVINEVEAAFYLNRNERIDEANIITLGQQFVKRLSCHLIVTLGENGSLVFSGDDYQYIEAFQVPVVETTGAGDSFLGAMTAMLIRASHISTACRVASMASSITIQNVGAQEAMPTHEQLNNEYPLLMTPD